MKLVRLVSDDINCIFSNDLVDLVLQPNSKVALSSANFDTSEVSIVLSETNNTIKLLIMSESKSINLGVGKTISGSQSLLNLLKEISFLFNTSLDYGTSQERGVEVLAKLDELSNKVQIGYLPVNVLTESKESIKASLLNITGAYTTLNAIFRPTGNASIPTDEKLVFFRNVLAKGTGFISARISECKEADEGFTIGLTDTEDMRLTTTSFADDKYKIAVRVTTNVVGTSASIEVSENGGAFVPNATEINTNHATNDDKNLIMFRRSLTNIEAILIRRNSATGGSEEIILGSVEFNINKQDLFAVCKFSGSVVADTAIDNIRYYFSPFQVITNTKNNTNTLDANDIALRNPALSLSRIIDGEDMLDLGGVLSPPISTVSGPTNNVLQFTNENNELSAELANFLGFEDAQFPKKGAIKSRGFTAFGGLRFSGQDFTDSYIVELLNLPVESYDGSTGRKRSILYQIPVNNNNENGVVNFSASPLIFLDLNNLNPLLVRTIRLRIINRDNSPILTRGQSSVVLLFSQ